MPCRVNVVHRVIRRIRVQVLRPRAVRVSAYRILLNGDPYSPIVPQKEPLQALFSSSIPVPLCPAVPAFPSLSLFPVHLQAQLRIVVESFHNYPY